MESDSAVPNMPIIEVSQWRILRQLRDILAPMETVTKIWESETEPSMNRVGVEVFNLKTVWGDMLQKEVDAYYDSLLLEEPAIICFFRSLLLNLDRRFPQLGMDTDLAAWGNIFDPRFKGMLLKELGIYDASVQRLKSFVEDISRGQRRNDLIDLDIGEAGAEQGGDDQTMATPAERLLIDKTTETEELTTASQDFSHEMSVYMKIQKPPKRVSILKFWSENKALLPLLSKAAQVTLGVPCSSSSIERTFKAGVHIVTNHRSRLNPELVEGSIIAKANGGRVDLTGLDEEVDEEDNPVSSDMSSDDEEEDSAEDAVLSENNNRHSADMEDSSRGPSTSEGVVLEEEEDRQPFILNSSQPTPRLPRRGGRRGATRRGATMSGRNQGGRVRAESGNGGPSGSADDVRRSHAGRIVNRGRGQSFISRSPSPVEIQDQSSRGNMTRQARAETDNSGPSGSADLVRARGSHGGGRGASSPLSNQDQTGRSALSPPRPQRLTGRQQHTLHSYFGRSLFGAQQSRIQEDRDEESSDRDDIDNDDDDDYEYPDDQFDDVFGMNVDD